MIKIVVACCLLFCSSWILGQEVLKEVYFDKEKYELQATSYEQLNALVSLLKERAEVAVKIAGHTDNKGNEEVNMTLSIRRAEAVAAYLIKEGVAHHRIKAVGYGEFKPIADNATEEGKQKNRRVTFQLVEGKTK